MPMMLHSYFKYVSLSDRVLLIINHWTKLDFKFYNSTFLTHIDKNNRNTEIIYNFYYFNAFTISQCGRTRPFP